MKRIPKVVARAGDTVTLLRHCDAEGKEHIVKITGTIRVDSETGDAVYMLRNFSEIEGHGLIL